jgi:single-stranded DNA-binding protein
MHQLNSLLIEGTVKDHPEAGETPDGGLLTIFTIFNTTFRGVSNDRKKKISELEVVAENTMAKEVEEKCTPGRSVRIIGHIEQFFFNVEGISKNMVMIAADHIEYKG